MLPDFREISDNARAILLAADADLHHTVMHMNPGFGGNWSFDTTDQTIASGTDYQSHGQWEAALLELVDQRLLVREGNDAPPFYKVTDSGHEVAQNLR